MVPPATLRHVEPLPRRTTSAGTRAVPTEIALWLLDSGGPHVDIAIPVYNEEADLEASVRRLHAYLSTELPFSFRITVADNASTDGTWVIARRLERELSGVTAVHLDEKGRGRALRHVWTRSDAAVLAYMDVDLSTDLAAVLPLVAPLLSGHSDMAIGTRLARGSRVVRGTKREVISRCYNFLLRATLSAGFSDAQCGFKAIRADRARALLPLVQDTGWFFDTELLFFAERAGMRIHEVPVDWVDDPDSRVDLASTAVDDLKGIARLVRGLVTGCLPLATLLESSSAEQAVQARPGLIAQLARFSAVGVVSTVAYVALFIVLRTGLPALGANALALLFTAVANTAVNRRVTFGVRSRAAHLRHQLQGIVVFAVGLALTSGALAVLHDVAPHAGRGLEVGVLVTAGTVATALRFVAFRSWVFRGASPRPPVPSRPDLPSSMPRSSP
jgi:putative flippase GtrA